ncbi:MAG: ABC transporter permease [Ilumatobacteraceae bacterium]
MTTRVAARQTLALTKRSTLAIIRQPALIVPSFVFPLFFAALSADSFGKTTRLPGFPLVDSFLQFALASTILQGVLFGSITGAAALATDIEIGFFDRLLVAPTARTGIVLGNLMGSAIFGAVQSAIFICVLLPFGVRVESGIPGIMVMIISGGLIALGIAAIMSAVAIRTGSAEAVQGAFPLLFVLLFFSSVFFPRQTMHGVYKTIATFNPISYLVEGLRSLILDGFSLSAIARSIFIPIGICVFGTVLALSELRRRIRAK